MTLAAYVRAHAPRFVAELAELVAFPSVSSVRGAPMEACARWLARALRRAGARDARLVATGGPPVVVGRIGHDRRRPTVLIYGHYDVQPAAPAWRPFSPRLRDGYLIGRGASDAKGQLFAHVAAVEAARAVTGRLPVNVVFLIEGEEEIGSPHLPRTLARLAGYLASDVAVVSDTAVLGIDRPSITYSLRGDLYLDVEARAAVPDLHSGTFGGTVQNVLRALVRALASLHDARGAVAVPGFAAGVAALPARERRFMREVGPSEGELRSEAGGAALDGDRAFSAYERATIRPSIEIAGVAGGYTGPGVHGVIPAHASAKLDVRLVPHQDPDRVHRAIFAQLARELPRSIELATHERMRARPVQLDRRHPAAGAATRAMRRGFGRTPVFVRSGGSIPVVSTLVETLGIPTVLMGFGLPDDRAHGPLERYSLAMFGRAIATSAAFLGELAR